MLGQPSHNLPCPRHFLICLWHPQVLRRSHPIRSLSRCTLSASSTQMTLVAFQSGHAQETNMSWLPFTLMAILSSRKCSSPRVTTTTLWSTNPLWHAWQLEVLQLISKSSTVRPVQLTRKLSLSSGMPSSNSFRLICISVTKQNAPFARSRTTSSQFWPALIPYFPHTFDTFSSTGWAHPQSSPPSVA